MKRIQLIMLAIFVASVAAILVISPSKAISQQKISQTGNVIPDDVAQILSNSCTSCHNTGGSKMAESMWNFSAWGTYPAEKQAKKAVAICNAITKGIMPPASVKKANPEKMPTAAQIEIICKWSNSLSKK
jgi:hypothetical protein